MDRIETLVNNAKTIYTKNQEEIIKLKKLEKKRLLDKSIPIRLIDRDNNIRDLELQRTISKSSLKKDDGLNNEKNRNLLSYNSQVSSLYNESNEFDGSYAVEDENKQSEPLSLMLKYINEINQVNNDQIMHDSNITESELISENPSVSEEKINEKLLSIGRIKIDTNQRKIIHHNPLDNEIYAEALKGTKIINNGNINIIHRSLNEQELTKLRSNSVPWRVQIASSTSFTIGNAYENDMRLTLIAATNNEKKVTKPKLNDIPEVQVETSKHDDNSEKSCKNEVQLKISDKIAISQISINKHEFRSQTLQKRNTLAARQSYFERTPTKQRPSLDQLLGTSKPSLISLNTINRPSGSNLDQLMESPLTRRKKSMVLDKNTDNNAKSGQPSIEQMEINPASGPQTNKTQVKSRQQKMFNEIQTNIINSNLNINDPGNFYKNWLQEIHNKQIEEKTKKHGDGEKISKRLDKLQDLLKDI
jgi:hypothetical protein